MCSRFAHSPIPKDLVNGNVGYALINIIIHMQNYLQRSIGLFRGGCKGIKGRFVSCTGEPAVVAEVHVSDFYRGLVDIHFHVVVRAPDCV